MQSTSLRWIGSLEGRPEVKRGRQEEAIIPCLGTNRLQETHVQCWSMLALYVLHSEGVWVMRRHQAWGLCNDQLYHEAS
jgi:hypothetical protein